MTNELEEMSRSITRKLDWLRNHQETPRGMTREALPISDAGLQPLPQIVFVILASSPITPIPYPFRSAAAL